MGIGLLRVAHSDGKVRWLPAALPAPRPSAATGAREMSDDEGRESRQSALRQQWRDIAASRAAHFARADDNDRLARGRLRRRRPSEPSAEEAGEAEVRQNPREQSAKSSVPMGTLRRTGRRRRGAGGGAAGEGGEGEGAAAEASTWDGPWTVARQLNEQVDEAAAEREQRLKEAAEGAGAGAGVSRVEVKWSPRAVAGRRRSVPEPVPSLERLCLNLLVEHHDALEALGAVPPDVRASFADALCRKGVLNKDTLGVIVEPGVRRVHIPNAAPIDEAQLSEALARLEAQSLEGLCLDNAGRCVSDAGGLLRVLGERFADSLEELHLNGCFLLSDRGCTALLESLRSLRSLSFMYNHRFGSAACRALEAASFAPQLAELRLGYCPGVDADALLALLPKLTALEALNIAGMEKMDDASFAKVVERIGGQLRSLDLSGCEEITGESLKLLGRHCGRLEHLRLEGCYGIEGDDLKVAFEEGAAQGSGATAPLAQLKTLCLREVETDDETVEAIAKHAGASLRTLELDSSGVLTDRSLLAIGRRCNASLRTLDLSFQREVTDDGLGWMVDHCTALRHLALWGCTQVTMRFLQGHRNIGLRVEGSFRAACAAKRPKVA